MPLTLNVGFNRKVGEPNYGSRGASVNLQLELDSGLVDQPERLKDRVRQLFMLAKTSVDEELAQRPAVASNIPTSGSQRDSTRRATASQIRALQTIADRQQLDLTAVLQDRFGSGTAEELSITEASQLIDEFRSATNGHGAGERR
jgi:hypothetical protein